MADKKTFEVFIRRHEKKKKNDQWDIFTMESFD